MDEAHLDDDQLDRLRDLLDPAWVMKSLPDIAHYLKIRDM
jgi:hypothetical protein